MKQILKHRATFQVNIQNHDGLNKNHQGNKIRCLFMMFTTFICHMYAHIAPVHTEK